MSFGASQFRSVLSSIEKLVSGSDIEHAFSEGIAQMGPILSSLGLGNSNAANMYETEENIVVEIQVPGIDRSQLKLWIEGQMLFVSCERDKNNQSEQARYYQTEFANSDLSRSICLPKNTDTKKVQASVLRGILTIKFSKLPETEKIEIIIE
jgi:HSP20 family molecular chaperone IbpA